MGGGADLSSPVCLYIKGKTLCMAGSLREPSMGRMREK
ncbi:hypothetical protein CLS_28580 [[Clostridium] cf. saccharolyticum K10]|nr:hypothetical protein CLS_28580 [[Clostridium] cf. saccharolyticum K10]